MSHRTAVHESLPYIDAEPTAAERAAAEALIAAEAASASTSTTSSPEDDDDESSNNNNKNAPSQLPSLREPTFTPLMTQELERVSRKAPLEGGIDLSRYEADDDDDDNDDGAGRAQQLPAALSRAYASSTYVSSRHAHLRLLDQLGRNAWLLGNWQAEAEAAALDREVAAAKAEVDLLVLERRRAQDAVADELRGLDAAWRAGVGRVLETELAVDQLRARVLDQRRALGDADAAAAA